MSVTVQSTVDNRPSSCAGPSPAFAPPASPGSPATTPDSAAAPASSPVSSANPPFSDLTVPAGTAFSDPSVPAATGSASRALTFGSGQVSVAAVEASDPLVLMAAVGVLSAREVERLDEAESEAYVVACERVTAAIHARQSLAMDTLAGQVDERMERQRSDRPLPQGVPVPDAHSIVASMLAPALHCSTRAVRKRLEADRWLVCASESTFAVQWDGDLERFRADVVVEAGRDLDPGLRATFEALVLETSLDEVTGELALVSPNVRALNRSQLSRRATNIARELDPDSQERAARRAHEDRRVVVTPDRRPGMARWQVLLPSKVSQEVFAAVDALAGQYARVSPGTAIEGHRADALADLVLGNAHVETTVELVVPVLAAAEPAPAPETPTASPASIPDPAPATTLVEVVAELRPVIADASAGPSGHPDRVEWFIPGPVDVARHGTLLPATVADVLSRPDTLLRIARLDADGSLTQDPAVYRPNAALRRRLRARDGTCRFPGCQTPATRCDLDHVVPHPLGPTDPHNLLCLCRTHHRFKHHGGWRAVLAVDGTVTWTAPDGRQHTTRPRPHQIVEELRLGEHLDPQLSHDLGRGWFPGLPTGMSLADLVLAESALPDEPPEADDVPAPPPDWRELDSWLADDAPTPSVLERQLEHWLALAA